ncbi:transposase family protein [Streptomyces sp. NPDC059224]|uniref:helix-turn-helix domain-containing protein n=1 Tax=Streptomyces sp. NPDC059224 TaxID=3346775 RepID=UPI00368EC73A
MIISNRRITGLTADVIAELVAEIGPLWHERQQARLASRQRNRAVGAGAKHRLVFVDRLLATLVHLRHCTTHDVLACRFGVDRSTITRAIVEVRAPARRAGMHRQPRRSAAKSGRSRRSLGVTGKAGIIDGTEIRVRRPAAERKDRDRFISGKNKQNAVKSPGRRTRGRDPRRRRGYQGLGAQLGGRVVTPPHRKFKKNAPDWYEEIYERERKAHSSRRIRVEHGIAHLKNWRAPARHLDRREHERHRSSHRRPAVPPTDRGPQIRTADVNPEPHRSPRRLTAYPARAR